MASKTVTKSFEYFNYFWCDYILALRFYIDATDFISRFYHIHMTSTRQLYSAIQYVNDIIMGQANEKMKLTCLLETIFHDVFTGHCLIFPSEILRFKKCGLFFNLKTGR